MAAARVKPDGFPLNPSPSARDAVVRDIMRGLYDGRYEPGQRLSEAKLTSAYGISRGPVREALNILAGNGIVDLTHQRGGQIRVLRVAEAIDTLVVAQTLIGLSASLAAERHHDDATRAGLEAAVDAVVSSSAQGNGAAFALARDGFYQEITRIADNEELTRLLPTVRVHLIRVQFRSVLRANDTLPVRDYRRMAEAVLGGRPKDADAAARAHINRAITSLRAYQMA